MIAIHERRSATKRRRRTIGDDRTVVTTCSRYSRMELASVRDVPQFFNFEFAAISAAKMPWFFKGTLVVSVPSSELALCRTTVAPSSTTTIVTRSEAERTTRTAAMAALWASVPISPAHQVQSREERK